MSLDWSQIEEGDELVPERSFLDKDDVRAYARINGTDFARFTDDDGARKEGLPGMIAPGNMSMGLIASFLERWAGPRSLERLGTTFRGLILPGNTITIYGVVTEKHEDTRSVEIDVWIESHESERLVIGTATVKIS